MTVMYLVDLLDEIGELNKANIDFSLDKVVDVNTYAITLSILDDEGRIDFEVIGADESIEKALNEAKRQIRGLEVP